MSPASSISSPPTEQLDGPYGDIVYLIEGPEGALYYVDLGFSDISGRSVSARSTASATWIPTCRRWLLLLRTRRRARPRSPSLSRAPARPIPKESRSAIHGISATAATSTAANPAHTYTSAGPYQARLTVSDGVNSTLSTPLEHQRRKSHRSSRPLVPLLQMVDRSGRAM